MYRKNTGHNLKVQVSRASNSVRVGITWSLPTDPGRHQTLMIILFFHKLRGYVKFAKITNAATNHKTLRTKRKLVKPSDQLCCRLTMCTSSECIVSTGTQRRYFSEEKKIDLDCKMKEVLTTRSNFQGHKSHLRWKRTYMYLNEDRIQWSCKLILIRSPRIPTILSI